MYSKYYPRQREKCAMKWIKYWWIVIVAMLISTAAVFAIHEEAKGPEKFGRYEFKEQDIKGS
jgi:hypothetical protein